MKTPKQIWDNCHRQNPQYGWSTLLGERIAKNMPTDEEIGLEAMVKFGEQCFNAGQQYKEEWGDNYEHKFKSFTEYIQILIHHE